MWDNQEDRRDFIKALAGFTAVSAPGSRLAAGPSQETAARPAPLRLRFSVIGLNHGHIYGQVAAVQDGGGELASFPAKEEDLAEAFLKRYPAAKRVKEERERFSRTRA